MEIDGRKNFKFSEWPPGSGTADNNQSEAEETETLILRISSSGIHNEFLNSVIKMYSKQKQCSIVLQLLQQKNRIPELKYQLGDAWLSDYTDNNLFLKDGLLYHREKKAKALIVINRNHISPILK
ncbi:hypothetical protein O181_006644 [Austropuccinia psidii MF-1]|uniref:Uncharacterized protein n=1 Tax=Austropuccinia psidii MF-1 TaxID=1389203 RepID=A0A9Q3GH33_9BASI|nr:hypothetical protein [Austropuccinia psidii MF-1]